MVRRKVTKMESKKQFKMALWQNKETGEVLTFREMKAQGRDEYDLDDESNMFGYLDYYEPIKIIYE